MGRIIYPCCSKNHNQRVRRRCERIKNQRDVCQESISPPPGPRYPYPSGWGPNRQGRPDSTSLCVSSLRSWGMKSTVMLCNLLQRVQIQ